MALNREINELLDTMAGETRAALGDAKDYRRPSDTDALPSAVEIRLANLLSKCDALKAQLAKVQTFAEIKQALENAFPHFADGQEATPEIVRQIGTEFNRLEMDPGPHEIEFADQNGKIRKIVYETGDRDAGIPDGWSIPEDADWIVVRGDVPEVMSKLSVAACTALQTPGMIWGRDGLLSAVKAVQDLHLPKTTSDIVPDASTKAAGDFMSDTATPEFVYDLVSDAPAQEGFYVIRCHDQSLRETYYQATYYDGARWPSMPNNATAWLNKRFEDNEDARKHIGAMTDAEIQAKIGEALSAED